MDRGEDRGILRFATCLLVVMWRDESESCLELRVMAQIQGRASKLPEFPNEEARDDLEADTSLLRKDFNVLSTAYANTV